MKKSLSILTLLTFLAFCSFAQTIRRVTKDINITGVNIYSTVQAAHDAAVAGDIIYLEPISAGNYGGLSCSKPLTFIGNGFAELNNNSSTTSNPPADGRFSSIASFQMLDGSQNSKLIGIRVNESQSNIYVPNITIDRCNISGPFSYAIELRASSSTLMGSNLIITKSRINGFIVVSNPYLYPNLGSGCVITNNIFNTGGASLSSLNNCVIKNNIFNTGIVVAASAISDNIFFGSGVAVTDYNISNTNSISNNISVGASGLPNGNGNINGVVLSSIFTNPSPNGSTPDSGFQLNPSSPAIGNGTGGSNMGVFAGTSPFVLSGLPPVPIITFFTISGVGNSSTPLQVSVNVRGNN